MPGLRGKALPLVLVILSTCSYGQDIMTRDSAMTQSMRSVIYYRRSVRGGGVCYINGKPASDDQVKAACMSFQSSAAVYARYEKMMSHINRPLRTFLIGEALALVASPLYTQPAIYKSPYWQSGIVILAAGSSLYFLGWMATSKFKFLHGIQLYNRSLFNRAGLPTRGMRRRIKSYYGKVFQVF
jgi:hypothetical protein